MATITYSEYCPTCLERHEHEQLSCSLPDPTLFCPKGHRFSVEDIFSGFGMEVLPEPEPIKTQVAAQPAPSAVQSDPDDRTFRRIEDGGVRAHVVADHVMVHAPERTVVQNPDLVPRFLGVDADGCGVFVVRIKEFAFTSLKTVAEEANLDVAEIVQRVMDNGADNNWF